MIDSFRVLWQALLDMRDRGYGYIWANLLFVGLCLPVFTAPAAFSALMYLGYMRYNKTPETELEAFWSTLRQNIWRGLRWGSAHFIFLIIHVSNMISYANRDGIYEILYSFWILITIIWVGVVFYTWPLYYSMETSNLIGATRNAIVMVFQNPFFTMLIIIYMVLAAILSTVFVVAWILLTWGFFSAISNAAVSDRIAS